MKSQKFIKSEYIKYWRRKYLYFIIINLIYWYFTSPGLLTNHTNLTISILPLDIIFNTNLGGFFELHFFEFIIYNFLAAFGIYAVSVSVFVISTGIILNSTDPFKLAAMDWLLGLKDKSTPKFNLKTMFAPKEKKDEKTRKSKQLIFNISIIYIPIISKTIVDVLKNIS